MSSFAAEESVIPFQRGYSQAGGLQRIFPEAGQYLTLP